MPTLSRVWREGERCADGATATIDLMSRREEVRWERGGLAWSPASSLSNHGSLALVPALYPIS